MYHGKKAVQKKNKETNLVRAKKINCHKTAGNTSIMNKQKTDQEEEEEDRISQLPESLLHHILCYLSQKQAVQTCVLSKSWRHLGPTRPQIFFDGIELFNGNEEMYLSVLEKTFQRYNDQKLSIQEIIIFGMKKSFELFEKWIPIVLQNMGVKMFVLFFDDDFSKSGSFIRLPLLVLSKAVFLKELELQCCQIISCPLVDDDEVRCKHLRTLTLNTVYITDAILEKIISSCPLIEELLISSCKGLQTMKLTKAPNLKTFTFLVIREGEEDSCRSIEIIDAPSIESIDISYCPNWIIQNYNLPRLKSLCLYRVPLSNELIDKFSTNFPCLENLSLLSCFSSSEQFKLSSRSIKHLTIWAGGPSLKAAIIIDATNILYFEFLCQFVPSSFSFTTTSTEWKSKVCVGPTFDYYDGTTSSSMFHRLSEIFKALSTSQISLRIVGIPKVVPDYCGGVLLPFEDLSLEENNSFSSVPDFLNGLFRNFRPRNIQQIWSADHYPYMREYKERENQLIEFLWKTLLLESERAQYFGLQNLEDVKMEASYENEEEWCGVEGTSSFSEFALPWDELKIRFRLKWRIE